MKTLSAATTLGMSEKYDCIDVKEKTYVVWSSSDKKFQAREGLKIDIWPPGMLEWGDYTNPYK